VDDDERAEVVLMVKRLRLAAWDMDRAHTAAICIPNPAYRGDVRALLETALAVIYARMFTISYASLNLGDDWVPEGEADFALHEQLLDLRGQVYAHTDDTEWRMVANVRAMLGGMGEVNGVWSASMCQDLTRRHTTSLTRNEGVRGSNPRVGLPHLAQPCGA
jgi:hypothetical protein